jgi:hypothetical protein
MISIENKVIFTHPPRCGGTSFESLLGLPESGEHFEKYKHASLTDHLNYISISKLDDIQFKKISIIRNPWARMVSWFFFIKKRKNPFVKNTNFQKFVENSNFNQFVEYVNYNLEKQSLLKRPYSFYMCDKDIFRIDFIIRYENYEHDIINALKLLNISNISNIPNMRSSCSPVNYRDYYSSKSKKIIENLYIQDIEFFKYLY